MRTTLQTLKSFWWLFIAIPLSIVSGILLFRLLKKTKQTDDINANEVFDTIGVNSSLRPRLNKAASELAHHLGTNFAWWNPRSWSENDYAVFKILKSLKQSEFDIVKRIYAEVYTDNRTLLTDIVKFLDKKYYDQLNLS